MRRHVPAVDLLLGDAILVHAERGQHGPGPGVDLSTPIADDAHDDFLPRVLAPRLAVSSRVHVLDILDHTHHGASKQLILLVVHGDDDEKLCMPRLGEELLAQGEALLVEELGIACCS